MHLAEILTNLDRAFKESPAFQKYLEHLLAIRPFDVNIKPYEPNDSDGLVLTVIMLMAEFAEQHL